MLSHRRAVVAVALAVLTVTGTTVPAVALTTSATARPGDEGETGTGPDLTSRPGPSPSGADPSTPPGDPAGGSGTVPLDRVDPAGLVLPRVGEAATDAEADARVELDSLAVPGLAASGAAALSEPDGVVVGLTAPLDTAVHDVTVVGASWDPTEADVLVDVRVGRDGVWGEWEALAVDDGTDGGEGRPGSEPYVVTDGADVQVRLVTTDGAPAPTGARLQVFGEDSAATAPTAATSLAAATNAATDAATATTAATDAVTTLGATELAGVVAASASAMPQPTIRSRASWGAVAPSGAMDVGQVRGVTVHHTAGSNTYDPADVPGVLRGIQSFHMSGRGWSDIGYNFLVDRYGGVWEGRAGGIKNTTKGVHAASFNGITTGVSVMGNFDDTAVTTAIKNSLTSLVAWKLALHGVDASGTMSFNGTSYPTIVGHRDVPDASTACPGKNLYAYLPALRAAVASRQVFPRELLDHDLDGDGVADVLVGSGTGRTYLGSHDPLASPVRIGNGWAGMDLVVGSPSLRGGSRIDLVHREAATGRLSVYHGNGRGGFTSKTVWGLGWTSVTSVIAPGDWTGDRRTDLLAVDGPSGHLYLYRGDGAGNLGTAAAHRHRMGRHPHGRGRGRHDGRRRGRPRRHRRRHERAAPLPR